MATWGIVATVNAPEDKVLAFVAHHLSLGAEHLWLYFDDPATPVPPALVSHPRVTVTLCDAAHWAAVGKPRAEAHQHRQTLNARFTYRQARTDWLTHIDVDEFIHTSRPVAEVLDDAPHDAIAMKLEPYEAMHDPMLPDDIYTAREFRGAIRHEHWPRRRAALGDYRKVIRDGMLSHTVGKVIFRTGIKGLLPKLHAVVLGGEFVKVPDWHPELKLLHFHAQDRQAWLAALPFRLTKGAYQFRPELQKHLMNASPEEIDRFYLRTQVLALDVAEDLRRLGRVLIVDLHLRDKVRDQLGVG
jgi:Glycosyl transferase family 2